MRNTRDEDHDPFFGRKAEVIGVSFLLFVLLFIPFLQLFITAGPAGAAPGDTRDSGEPVLILKGTVVTMNDAGDVIEDGKVVVRGKMIEEVLSSNESVSPEYMASSPVVIETDGFIYPGLLNIHSHPMYNMLPIWDVPGSYTNRYQWTEEEEYKPEVSYPKQLLTGNEYHLGAEVVKYAEVKELVGGGVAIQGVGQVNSKYSDILIHNVEMTNYGEDHVYQNVLPVDTFDEEYYQDRYESGRMKAFFTHLCEGTDTDSREEFGILKSKGLLNDATVIIHGTALRERDFEDMAAADAHLVWSPLSNLLLYGKTADVVTADKAGVEISLAPDWSPSGSKNTLVELKYADMLNRYRYNGHFSYRDLVEMVTVNPARACEWQNETGTIREGLYAEMMVVHNETGTDPYRTLVEATEKDVELVLVEGDPLYGDVPLMEELKGEDMEIVTSAEGFNKAIDTTKEGVPFGEQRLSEIESALRQAMQFNKSDLDDKYSEMRPIPLDPYFTSDDDEFFISVRESKNMDVEFDLEQEYYWWRGNLTYTGGGSIEPNVDPALDISGVRAEPISPDQDDEVVVRATVQFNRSLASVIVDYRLSGGPPASMDMSGTGEEYSANIGKFPGDSVLIYNVTATSSLGNTVTSGNHSLTIRDTGGGGTGDDDNGDDDNGGRGSGTQGGEEGDNKDTIVITITVLAVVLVGMVVGFLIIIFKNKRRKGG